LGRAWRWCRRNPALATVTAALVVVVLTLAVGGPLLAWHEMHLADQLEERNRDLLDAQQQQKANLDLARKAVDDCFNVAQNDPLFQRPRMERARKLLLEKTLPFYKQFQARGDDPGVQAEEAGQLLRVGEIERSLALTDAALKDYRHARDRYLELVKAHPTVPDHQFGLARTHLNLGVLLTEMSKPDQAIEELQQGRDVLRGLLQHQPGRAEYQQLLGIILNNLGMGLGALNRRQEALKEYRQAEALQLELVKAHPDQIGHQTALARTYLNRGVLLSRMDRSDEALGAYQQTRDLYRKLVKRYPNEPEFASALGNIHNNRGILLRSLGKGQEALEEFRQARDLQLELVKVHPDLPQYQDELARSHFNLGAVLHDRGEHAEALKELQRARQLRIPQVRAYPNVPLYRTALARVQYRLGNLLVDLDRGAEAEAEYQQSRELYRQLVQAHPQMPRHKSELAGTLSNLADLLGSQGKTAEALAEYQQSCELYRQLVQAHPETAQFAAGFAATSLNRGLMQFHRNQWAASLPDLDECIAQTERLQRLAPGHPQIRALLLNGLPARAFVLAQRGQQRQADADWQRVLELAPPRQRINLRYRRADSRARAGDYRRAADEADELGRIAQAPGQLLYGLSGIHALDAVSAGRDASRPLPERDKRSEQYARQAIALLHRAAAAGFFRGPASLTNLDSDTDFTELRQRDDFKRFRAGLKSAK
jgi:tetratricopeptide (TPR) repeat protein